MNDPIPTVRSLSEGDQLQAQIKELMTNDKLRLALTFTPPDSTADEPIIAVVCHPDLSPPQVQWLLLGFAKALGERHG